MKLKTFRGPDFETALERARAELGPDALVLATNEIPGRMGLTAFEVTVGLDTRRAAPTTRSRWRGPKIEPRQCAGLATPFAKQPAVAEPHPALRAAVESLIRSGLTRDLALRFAQVATRDLDGRADAAGLAAAAANAMGSLMKFHRRCGSRPLFVVGPPGAGKTTAVARLAAREPDGAVFAETDRCRVGAREQAEGLARLVGVPLKPVASPAELCTVLGRESGGGRVLVDTAGVGGGDGARLERLTELRAVVDDADVAVLLPAGLHRDEARRVVQRFTPLRPTCIAFSKIDDGGRLGDLVSAVTSTGLPLSFVTNGHGVHDLEYMTARGLTALLLRAGFDRPTSPDEQEYSA